VRILKLHGEINSLEQDFKAFHRATGSLDNNPSSQLNAQKFHHLYTRTERGPDQLLQPFFLPVDPDRRLDPRSCGIDHSYHANLLEKFRRPENPYFRILGCSSEIPFSRLKSRGKLQPQDTLAQESLQTWKKLRNTLVKKEKVHVDELKKRLENVFEQMPLLMQSLRDAVDIAGEAVACGGQVLQIVKASQHQQKHKKEALSAKEVSEMFYRADFSQDFNVKGCLATSLQLRRI